MGKSKIEWTAGDDGSMGETWNPTRGCTKISPGCKHCYAETFAERFRGVKGHPYEQGFDLRLVPDKLDAPLHWKKPRRVFVNSMSDLFHEDVPDEYIDQVLAVAFLASWHTFQILTKRAERMARYFASKYRWALIEGVAQKIHHERTGEDPSLWLAVHSLPNVWLGVSVESQEYADARIPHLLRTPAAVRFLSCEPLLGPVNLTPWLFDGLPLLTKGNLKKQKNPFLIDTAAIEERAAVPAGKLHWVIVGGESGAGARPFFIQWARDIRDQCKAAGVPFFFKQAGSHVAWNGWSPPGGWWPKGTLIDDTGRGHFLVRLKAKKGGELEELPEDLRVREFPR